MAVVISLTNVIRTTVHITTSNGFLKFPNDRNYFSFMKYLNMVIRAQKIHWSIWVFFPLFRFAFSLLLLLRFETMHQWRHCMLLPLHSCMSSLRSLVKKLSSIASTGWACYQRSPTSNFCGNPSIPLQYLTELDREANNVNPTYSTWEVQDQMLLSWLESTLSSLILSRVLGSIHSYKVFGEDSRCLNIFYESKLSLILFLWLEIMCFFRSTSMLFSKAFRKSIAR